MLPADFGRRFLVFIDTEEEFDWNQPRRRDSVATTAISALPYAHHRLASFGIKPTYLVDFPVANNEGSAAIVRGLAAGGEAVIGAQLHPWVNPPLGEDMSSTSSFVGNLPIDIERAKLKMLTFRITQTFGAQPVVYRAGRYGVGANSARLLAEQGYRLDVSVRALHDYSDEDGPDFSRHPVWPWWADADRRVLELPLSAAYAGHLHSFGQHLYPASAWLPLVRSFLARAGLLQRVALTPEGMPIKDVLAAIDVMLDRGVSLFSISFHSPSIEPGHTPYVRNAVDLANFWRWWDAVLDRFAAAGVAPIDSLALIAAADAAR